MKVVFVESDGKDKPIPIIFCCQIGGKLSHANYCNRFRYKKNNKLFIYALKKKGHKKFTGNALQAPYSMTIDLTEIALCFSEKLLPNQPTSVFSVD